MEFSEIRALKVGEVVDLYLEKQNITAEIYDTDKSITVWAGALDEMPEEYSYALVGSLNIPAEGKVGFNIYSGA